MWSVAVGSKTGSPSASRCRFQRVNSDSGTAPCRSRRKPAPSRRAARRNAASVAAPIAMWSGWRGRARTGTRGRRHAARPSPPSRTRRRPEARPRPRDSGPPCPDRRLLTDATAELTDYLVTAWTWAYGDCTSVWKVPRSLWSRTALSTQVADLERLSADKLWRLLRPGRCCRRLLPCQGTIMADLPARTGHLSSCNIPLSSVDVHPWTTSLSPSWSLVSLVRLPGPVNLKNNSHLATDAAMAKYARGVTNAGGDIGGMVFGR